MKGLVVIPTFYRDVIQALVHNKRNNSLYLVEISTEGPYIHSCSYPYFGTGIYKHIVALGLAYLARPGSFQTIRDDNHKILLKKLGHR